MDQIGMAQTKGDGPEPSYKPVDAYSGTEPPEWNDILRGILVALVEKNTLLHQINLQISKQDKSAQIRSTKEKVMEVFANQIATVLQNQDPRMNAWAVLEKWCWMMEMYSRAVEFKFNWRYVNSMNFLVNSPSSVYNVYIGSLNPDRFVELTHKYSTTPEEQAATQLVPSKKSRRFSSGTGLFSPEMSLYMEITKKDTAQSIAVVSTPESMPPVQLVSSTASSGFLLQGNTPMTTESPIRGRRGRAAAKYSNRTRVQQASNLESLPTSVADILNALSAVSSTTSAPTPPMADIASLKAVAVKEEPVEPKIHEPLEWSKELTVGLIEGIKLRPDLWSSDIEAPQDKNQLKDIVEGLKTIPGGKSLTVPLAISAWKMLSNFVRVPKSKLAVDFHLSPDELRSRLQFLVEKDAKTSFEATMGQLMANGINGHEMQVHLQQMLGLLSQPEISPRENQSSAQKRPRLASPSMRDTKKNCPSSPQVVTTWVPPKEEAYKNAFAAVTASTSNPTATAQILSTSTGIPLPNLFSVDHSAKEPKLEKKSQVNGLGKRNSTHLDGGVKEDKWTTMGRLVEHTCRELESKDPETAIQLQRELSEVLYRSQLQSLKRV